MNATPQGLHLNIPFRVRIGVTGDRALPDSEGLAEKISEAITTEIFNLYDEDSKKRIRSARHTPLAYSVLTSLAEGAERLVAHEVLKTPDSRIEVVLPCAKEDYLKNFISPESVREFRELLGRARRPITLNKGSIGDASQYIVDHCDVLLVLSDGEPSSGSSTAETLAYANMMERPVFRISPALPHEISVERGHGLNAKSISGIERFNAFPVSHPEQEEYVTNVYHNLFDGEAGLPDEAKSEVREKLLPFYVRASRLAKRSQKLYRRAGLLIYAFSAAAVAAVALSIFPGLAPWAFSLELGLLLTILVIVIYANQRRTHKKWIESRFLAERIRCANFLAACGVEASPIRVLPYMGGAEQADEWMVMTFNEIWGRLPTMKGCQGQCCTAFVEFARKRWIKDQIGFHEKKAESSERISRRLEQSGIVVFGLAVVAAALHLILLALHVEWLERPLTFAAISLPAVGAAIGGIRTHREYSRLAKRSKNMAMNLKALDERFSSINEPEALESLLRETEELMLLETQDWLMLMRFAKLEAAA